jgi:hypothetical protein
MKLLTTESQRHRDTEKSKTSKILELLRSSARRLKCTVNSVLDYSNRPTNNASTTNCISVACPSGQVNLPVSYKGLNLDCGYKIDLIVNEEVIVELKAVETILPVHEAQLLTYLKLSGKKVGLLINFNSSLLTQGIIRRVL